MCVAFLPVRGSLSLSVQLFWELDITICSTEAWIVAPSFSSPVPDDASKRGRRFRAVSDQGPSLRFSSFFSACGNRGAKVSSGCICRWSDTRGARQHRTANVMLGRACKRPPYDTYCSHLPRSDGRSARRAVHRACVPILAAAAPGLLHACTSESTLFAALTTRLSSCIIHEQGRI